jgi:hypothetical protein
MSGAAVSVLVQVIYSFIFILIRQHIAVLAAGMVTRSCVVVVKT